MKYKKVRFNVKRIVRLYRDGRCVAEIARMIGYPNGHGNNRTRAALVKGGLVQGGKVKTLSRLESRGLSISGQ